jgi:hypothetical protein
LGDGAPSSDLACERQDTRFQLRAGLRVSPPIRTRGVGAQLCSIAGGGLGGNGSIVTGWLLVSHIQHNRKIWTTEMKHVIRAVLS